MNFRRVAILISIIVTSILITAYWRQHNIEAVLGYVLAAVWVLICHSIETDNNYGGFCKECGCITVTECMNCGAQY